MFGLLQVHTASCQRRVHDLERRLDRGEIRSSDIRGIALQYAERSWSGNVLGVQQSQAARHLWRLRCSTHVDTDQNDACWIQGFIDLTIHYDASVDYIGIYLHPYSED